MVAVVGGVLLIILFGAKGLLLCGCGLGWGGRYVGGRSKKILCGMCHPYLARGTKEAESDS